MARKQVVSPKSPRTHLRQTPYTLPHRRPPGLHVPYEPPPRSWEEQHYDLTRSRTLSPHRSPSRGPPTPESPGLISPDTFYPAAFSPASEGYQLSPPPGTAYTDGPTGFHFIGHNRLSLGPFDCSTPPPYSAWPGQSQSVAIRKSNCFRCLCLSKFIRMSIHEATIPRVPCTDLISDSFRELIIVVGRHTNEPGD